MPNIENTYAFSDVIMAFNWTLFKEENKQPDIAKSHLVLHLRKREALNIQQMAPFWPHAQCESHTALFVSTMKSALSVWKMGSHHRRIYLLRIGRVSSSKLSEHRLCSPKIPSPSQCRMCTQNGHDGRSRKNLIIIIL